MKMYFPGFRIKALTLSYDDGVRSDIKLVNLLNRYGVKATFNLNSGLMGKEGGGKVGRLSYEECQALYVPSGHEVAIHTLTHPFLERLSYEECLHEVLADRLTLQKMTGQEIHGMAYPFGTYNDMVLKVLREAQVYYSRTCDAREDFSIPEDFLRYYPTTHHKNPRLMELTHKFLEDENKEPYLFYLWGHSYEFENEGNWNIIEDFLSLASFRPEVWYATNITIVNYVNAYRGLIRANNTIINNSNIDLYIEVEDKRYIAKAHSKIILD